MSNAHFAHAVGQTFKQSKNMPPVARGKNPFVGFAAGFIAGPIGVGLYLGSAADFFLTLTIVLLGSFFTAGLAAPVFWCLCGAWAFVRIHNSNSTAPLIAKRESAVHDVAGAEANRTSSVGK